MKARNPRLKRSGSVGRRVTKRGLHAQAAVVCGRVSGGGGGGQWQWLLASGTEPV